MERKTPQEVARTNRLDLSQEVLEENVELLNEMENSLRFLIQGKDDRLAMDQSRDSLGEKRILNKKLQVCISISSPLKRELFLRKIYQNL